MGYYILGIIIFLLLIIFISDLFRQARDSKDMDDFDVDEYFNRLQSQYPGTFAYREEFGDEYLDKDLEALEETKEEKDMKDKDDKWL